MRKLEKEVKEWFKVSEIANVVGVSKVSIYNKIKTIDADILQSLWKREKGITYYNIKAVDIIINAFNQNEYVPPEPDVQNEEEIQDNQDHNEYREKYILELENEIKYLKDQIVVKDDLIDKHIKLIENEQVLRKQEQQAITLLEEDRAKVINDKMVQWREGHFKEKYEGNKESFNFIKRFFNKGKKM